MSTETFILEVAPGAIAGWHQHKTLPSLTIAQAILESASGTSTLATKANNLFGIKGDHKGYAYFTNTKEFVNGKEVTVREAFKHYPTKADSIEDHGAFFTSTEWRKENYKHVVGETDIRKAVAAILPPLAPSGYATDPNYKDKIIRIVSQYDLERYDQAAGIQKDEPPEASPDPTEGESTMSYPIEKKLIPISQGQLAKTLFVIAHESGNPNNVGPEALDNEVAYMTNNATNAFTSHWVGGGGRIVQVAQTGKVQWGAGRYANPYSYAQVELARTNNRAQFQKDYKAYIWLLRQLATEAGIPKTLDTGKGYNDPGVKTHRWVSYNLGGTDHTDPIGYLASWGVSYDQFKKDIANGIGGSSQPSKPATPATGTLYRVQAGAFSKIENAQALEKRLEGAGIDAYVVEDGGLYKVQAGAYSNRTNAENQAKRIEKLGVQSYITSDAPEAKPTPAKPTPAPSPAFKLGDRVLLHQSASTYATGETIPAALKGDTYTVQQVGSGRVLLKELYSWVKTSDVSKATTLNYKPGNRVTLSRNASTYATGEAIPASIKGRSYTILQEGADRVLLKEIYSWVYKKDIY